MILATAGDTIWCEPAAEALERHDPDVVVLNSGDTKVLPNE